MFFVFVTFRYSLIWPCRSREERVIYWMGEELGEREVVICCGGIVPVTEVFTWGRVSSGCMQRKRRAFICKISSAEFREIIIMS